MAFYSRIIKIEGISYKQISFDSWQNLTTGEILDNTRMSGIINLVADRAVVPTVPAVILGACCTGGICVGDGQTAQDFCPPSVGIFYPGSTCAECLLGACCTGGTCYGGQLTSQSVCNSVGGIFYLGLTCNQCETGVFCTGGGSNRTCIRTGYRGEQLSNEFQPGATCSYCIMGTCCINGEGTVGVRQSNCTGVFFAGIFNLNACDSGSCCLGGTCNENIFRYNCAGVFNSGQTCLACSSGACCLPSGCTSTSQANCTTLGGTFFGGQECNACDTGACCNQGDCTNQRRGNFCAGTFYANVNCGSNPCTIGACCLGNTCSYPTTHIGCELSGGTFAPGFTCIGCATGAHCISPIDPDLFVDRDCTLTYFAEKQENDPDGDFFFGRTCNSCEIGACCREISGEQNNSSIQIRGNCDLLGASFGFFKGQTLIICTRGVFCTGSNEGQTCFGLGYLGQSLTNNFIVGATCNACILGACCTGGTCLGGGLTSQAACSSAGGLFFAGRTCTMCDYGVYCTGATCLSLGYRGQSLSNNFIVGATCSSCILGACCTGGTCAGGGQTSQAACNGLFYPGATCKACDYGVYCTGATCFELGYRAQALTNNFIQGATCNSCILGACCTGGTCLGGGQTSQAACLIAGGTFYAGATCFQCATGVFCTGSGLGQTCFGLGHRGQSLTNNFIAGATCNSCILGSCCTGGTCYGGTLTSEATCNSVGGLFFVGTTCISCDFGVFCTGANENKNCLQSSAYRAQNLSNEFITGGGCRDCNFGACCQGASCLGITSEKACGDVGGDFIDGATCSACSGATGICCTGSGYIDTPENCAIAGGHWFPSGTTALCITGSCCTGGTCIEEIVGKSGNCEFFIAGATCGICDSGVYCTGATCLQTGFRGQSLATVFIVGETCSSCIQGICCKDDYEYLQIAGGKEHSVALTTYGEVRGFGGNTYGQSGMTLALGYTGIAAGFYHTLAISTGGTVSAWGRNQYGQSTVPAGLTGVIQVAAGEYHSIALKFDGGVTCWGWNGQGQCNVPSGLTGVTMISAGGGHNLALKQDGTVVAWGYNYNGQTNVPAGLTGVIQVAAGYHHSLALLTDGGITCWGMTLYGQCNIPAGLTASKIAAGGYHTIILKADGGVTAFGRTGYDQTIVPAGLVAKQIAGGEFHSLAINMSNSAVTWGSNINGETNIGSSCESFNQKQCSFKSGVFKPGATQCSVCTNNVNCCLPGGTCSYILEETCLSQGGVPFAGDEDNSCLLCQLGAFCTGSTCEGYTLNGFNLTENFYANSPCEVCITGVCCKSTIGTISNQYACDGFTFLPGETDITICSDYFGLCCTGGTCSEVREGNCDGYYIPNPIAELNNLSCETNACEIGICCGENEIQSVTGGVCLGQMTRAECALTGGDFFSLSSGATCTNCQYIPMLGSALFEKVWTYVGTINNSNITRIGTSQQSGFTGNEIEPRREVKSSDSLSIRQSSTWLTYRDVTLWGAVSGATTSVGPVRATSTELSFLYPNFEDRYGTPIKGFTVWTTGISLSGTNLGNQGTTGLYDYSPVFELGKTSFGAGGNKVGATLGFINGFKYEVPRYMNLVIGYNNPADVLYNTNITYRAVSDFGYSRLDATLHAGLPVNLYNLAPTTNPFISNATDTEYSGPILYQMFAENPLRFRVRPVGSCCKGITCLGIVTQDHCTARGGTFYEGSRCFECSPNLIFGSCCTGGTYYGYSSLEECNSLSGVFFRGTTGEPEKCVPGVICSATKQCVDPNGYAGSVSTTTGQYLMEGQTACSACNAGLCCKGSTCLGYIPADLCEATAGTVYYDFNTCGSYCDTGICCSITGGCGTFTNRANCLGVDQVFVAGATAGQTCSACNSLMILSGDVPGITMTYVFNKQANYGRFFDDSLWVEATAGLKLKKIKLSYRDYRDTKTFDYNSNSIIKGITVTFAPGTIRKGNYYVHGLCKNPRPAAEYALAGYTHNPKQPYVSLTYDDYVYDLNGVYGFPIGRGPTDDPDSYEDFDLNLFMENYNNMVLGDGITLEQNDVILANVSNFDPTRTYGPPKQGQGYPYQVVRNRAETLAFGVLNCLGSTQAAIAGATLCFRPPVTWPLEDVANRPIHQVNKIDAKVPGQPGVTLFTVNQKKLYRFRSYAGSYFQTSEFGTALKYPVISPYYGAFGYRTDLSYKDSEADVPSVYGEQYLIGLELLAEAVYTNAVAAGSINYTQAQRKTGLGRIIQYGIDAFGAMKAFSAFLSSGAGQKSARTRPWCVIAGYYLGETGMYDPEATQMMDTVRTNHVLTGFWTGSDSNTPGGTCVSRADWRAMRWGGYTGSTANNYLVIRKTLADMNSHEARTVYQITNDPNNFVTHYAYPGHIYKGTISGYPATGPKGISFANMTGITLYVDGFGGMNVLYGNFARIMWGNTASVHKTDNPFGYKGYLDSQSSGSRDTFKLMHVKCISGTGSGATVYRIIDMKGSFTKDTGGIASAGDGIPYTDGGYQWYLDRPWEGPLPNHESVLEFYPFEEYDAGVTHNTTSSSGKTGALIFIINSNPEFCYSEGQARLHTSSKSPSQEYLNNSLNPWSLPYSWINYLQRNYGVTLESDAVRAFDMLKQYTFISPYNYIGPISIGNNIPYPAAAFAGFNWYLPAVSEILKGPAVGNANGPHRFRVNFARDFKGVIRYNGYTV